MPRRIRSEIPWTSYVKSLRYLLAIAHLRRFCIAEVFGCWGTRGPGCWFALSLLEGDVWAYADGGLTIMSSCPVSCAIAKDSSFSGKSAFRSN